MKLNYISDVVKILIFAAAVIITCILVALGFNAANTAKAISNSAIAHMTELNDDIKDSDLKMFDASEVYGSEVVNFIKKQLGDYSDTETAPIYVLVKTNASENTYTNGAVMEHIRNFSHAMYIKPTALFISELIKNENKLIVGVSFVQK